MMEFLLISLTLLTVVGIVIHGYFAAKLSVVPPIMESFIERNFAECIRAETGEQHEAYIKVAQKYSDQLSKALWGS
jgi:hypothetical protein